MRSTLRGIGELLELCEEVELSYPRWIIMKGELKYYLFLGYAQLELDRF